MGPKIFGYKKNSKTVWTQKFLGPNSFGFKNILDQKKVRFKNFFGQNKFRAKKNVGPKRILGQGLVKTRLVLAEIFHYTETLKNVAGTNVAWSNDPEIYANYLITLEIWSHLCLTIKRTKTRRTTTTS